jgi:uncharacterized membrane-anchored protein YjiN (DUF445 family)
MRAIATGLLGLMAALYVATSLADAQYPWLGYVRAFAEAGMVGACADWFAVTALFRRPLGLPIPHTGIIPRNKDRIGEALGDFIAENFLTAEVLDNKVRQLELAKWGGAWLRRPRQARALAERLAGMIPEFLELMPRDTLRDLAGSAATAAARAVPAAPTASRILAAVWNEGRAQVVFEWAREGLAAYLRDHGDVIRANVEAQSYKWMPKFVDRLIAEKITAGLVNILEEMRDPDHPWRQEMREAVETFIARLATDPALAAEAERLKLKALNDPGLRDQARLIWATLEARLSERQGEAVVGQLERLLVQLGEWLASDQAAQDHLNNWARAVSRHVIAPRRREIGHAIAQVVAGWDTESIVDKLELQVGRDLQYIRINGTLVGGLVGLALYALSQAVGW